jgi:hypothetical protein
MVIIGASWFVFSNNPLSAALTTGTALASATVNPYPGPSSVAPTPDLAATQNSIATLIALKNAEGTKAIQDFTTTPQLTALPFATGIYPRNQTAYQVQRKGIETENGWVGLIDGNKVSVWAGATVSDVTQGALYILYEYSDRFTDQLVLTTDKQGSLRIVAETNNRLTLKSPQGATYYFDVPGLAFVSSLSEPVPTITPYPTYTPVAPLPTVPLPTGYSNGQPTIQATVAP